MPWRKEHKPKHGHAGQFHCKQVSCFGVETGSMRRADLVSISLLFIALVSHRGLYTLVLVLPGSLSALPTSSSPERWICVFYPTVIGLFMSHLVVHSPYVLHRAWLPMK